MQRLPAAATAADLDALEDAAALAGDAAAAAAPADGGPAKRARTSEQEHQRQVALAPVAVINGAISRHLEMVRAWVAQRHV